VQQNLGLLEQQTSPLIAMAFHSVRPANFPQAVIEPLMLTVLDHHEELCLAAHVIQTTVRYRFQFFFLMAPEV